MECALVLHLCYFLYLKCCSLFVCWKREPVWPSDPSKLDKYEFWGWFFSLVSPLTQPFHINWKQELISISLCCTCGFVRGQLPHLHSFPTKFFPQKFYLQGWLLSFCSQDLSVATREGGFFSAVKKLMLASLINCLQAYLACRERTRRTDGCKHQALHFPHHQFNYCSFWKIINWHLF